MPDASSSSGHREHNQGKQDRSYTPEQKAAVDRVRRCKVTDYYAILDIEKTVTEGEIKKAYRRLALVMHPDKNGAPGADEAFKMVSRAFQVLSDPQKRVQYDKFGGDPDARGGTGGGGGGGASPFAGGFSPMGGFGAGEELSPEDLFNMFFGAGGGFGGFQAGFGGPFGEFVSFSGPGIRVQHFGGMQRRRRPASTGTTGQTGQANAQEEPEASLGQTFIQLLPLILLFLFPIFSSLFSELGSGYATSKTPDFRFEEIHPFTQIRTTPRHNIAYFVNPKEIREFGMTEKKLKDLDRIAEVRYVSALQQQCRREMVDQQSEIDAAMGWIWADGERARKAREKPLVACQRLRELGEGRVMN
ncbi:hypothetical protein BDZ91DRAFT_649861 [Kalaharituber pfeilii]|nr:hypothetical protein BDZ91DRAFT_649861 [Kalaharituber pfeilii]